MTNRLSHLMPATVAAGLLAATAIAIAATSGSVAGNESPSQTKNDGAEDIAAACLAGAEDCDETVDSGGPDRALICDEGPAVDCVGPIKPGDAVAGCEDDPCHDESALLPDPLSNDCKRLVDDVVTCIADPATPVSNEPLVKPAAPPDAGPSRQPFPGNAPEDQLEADIAAREECRTAGLC